MRARACACTLVRRCPSRHFGENQLSPRSLGISPLPTAHPKALQRPQVRPSSPHYRTFSLAMGSSRGFGSTPRHRAGRTGAVPRPCPPADALFGLGFPPAPALPCLSLGRRRRNSPAHSSIGTQSGQGHSPTPLTACGHAVSGSVSLPSRGAFHRSLTVLSAIGRWVYLAFERGRPCFPPGCTCRAVLRVAHRRRRAFPYGALTRCGRPFQDRSASAALAHSGTGRQPGPCAPPTPPRHRAAAH